MVESLDDSASMMLTDLNINNRTDIYTSDKGSLVSSLARSSFFGRADDEVVESEKRPPQWQGVKGTHTHAHTHEHT